MIVATVVLLRITTILWPSTISIDENTFFTVAQRMSVGELPYTTTLENKPPLLPLFQALPILVGASAPWQLRLFVALIVGITGVLVSRIVIWSGRDARSGLLAGLAFGSIVSIMPAGGASMSHHFANLLLAAVLLSATRIIRSQSASGFLLAGSLAAGATLTRTNYLIPVALVLLATLALVEPSQRLQGLVRTLLGGLAVAGTVILPYALTGSLSNLVYGTWTILLGPGGRVSTAILPEIPLWALPVLLSFLLLAIDTRIGEGYRDPVRAGRATAPACHRAGSGLLSTAAMIGVLASLALHDPLFDHHAGMLVVPFATQLGLRIGNPRRAAGSRRAALRHAALLVSVWSLSAVSLSLIVMSGPSGMVPTAASRRAVVIEAEVTEAVAGRLTVAPGDLYALSGHFVYWRLGIRPPDPIVTHPNGVVDEAFYRAAPLYGRALAPRSGFEAIQQVLDSNPRYLLGSPSLDEDYLVEGLSEPELSAVRERIQQDWRAIWVASDGDIVLRECISCG